MNYSRFLIPVFLSLVFIAPVHTASSSKGAKKVLPLDRMANVQMKTPEKSRYLPDKIIVRLRTDGTGMALQKATVSASLKSFLSRYSPRSIQQLFPEAAASVKPMDLSKFYMMTFTSPLDPFKIAQEISQNPEVLYAEPWFIYSVNDAAAGCTPNDSLRSLQWALTKIKADSAYCAASGDSTVTIGIVDTGVQWTHPDLSANIYINPGETGLDGQGHDKRTNGIDDDGDGFIDDWHGWDFGGADYNNPIGDNNPTPVNTASSHGTHVAGIANARTNNVTGVAGVANNCRIIAVKTGSDNDTRGGGSPFIVFGFEGMIYAAQHGAKAINCSWGGSGASQFEQEIIDSVTAMGSLVVAAAGNDGTEGVSYPAGYRNVISVAATTNSDAKASYSQYGETVDVSAPGGDASSDAGDILNTWYPNTYAYLAGTSMASPHVAGLAALVKSKFPSYSPIQVGEQIRVTCDDISAQNPSAALQHKLGKGRINALRAVTQNSWPSIRMMSYRAVDSISGNSNGILEPNETFALNMSFLNYLQPTSSSATVQLTTTDANVTIQQTTYALGTLATMGTAVNDAMPFVVHINPSVPAGHIVHFLLLTDDGSYHDYQWFDLLLDQPFGTHDVNNVQTSITATGHVGFNDFPDNTQGVGFVFKNTNELYEGSLLIGYSSTKIVDVVRNDGGGQNADFTSANAYHIATPGVIATQEGSGTATDDAAAPANKIGLTINTHSFAFHDAPDTNYVIVRYEITNTSGAQVSNLYAGLFMDWDIQPDYAFDKTSFDATRSLGYAWDFAAPGSVYCGVRALDTAASFRALANDGNIDLTKAGKWAWLSGGVVLRDTAADIHSVISEGPFTIANGGTIKVGFAVLAGSSLLDLRHNADFAKAKWSSIKQMLDSTAIAQVNPRTVSFGSVKLGDSKDTTFTIKNVGEDTLTISDASSSDGAFVPRMQAIVIPPGVTSIDSVRFTPAGEGQASALLVITSNSTTSPDTINLSGNGFLHAAFEYAVAPKWNLLSLPLSLANGSKSAVFPTSMSSAFGFSTISGYVAQDTLSVSKGFWLKFGVSQGVTINGISVDTDTVSVIAGWNLIGSLYSPIAAGNVGSVLPGLIASPFWHYADGRYSTSDTIMPGNGYWIKVNQDGQLVLTTSSLPPSNRIHIIPTGETPPPPPVDDKDIADLPRVFALAQNYPNPFNPGTVIQYQLPSPEQVTLTVYNVLGQRVAVLVNTYQNAGYKSVTFQTSGLSSGVYIYRLTAGSFNATKKMLLLR